MFRLSRVAVRSAAHARMGLANKQVGAQSVRCMSAVPEQPETPIVDATPVIDIPAAAVEVIAEAPEAPGMVSNVVMSLVENIHVMADLPYWGAIAALTVALRIALVPVAINTARSAGNMVRARPEMERVTNAMKNDPMASDPNVRMKYQLEMRELMKKHNFNPVMSMIAPLMQLPIFMGMYMGLSKMPTYYPELATGGFGWVTDLTAADPTYVLPIVNAALFLAMTEVASDANIQNGKTFKNVMRGLALVSIPVTMNFSGTLFMYFIPNAALSIVQTVALRSDWATKTFNIPRANPMDSAPLRVKSPIKSFQKALQKEKTVSEDAAPEILDGTGKFQTPFSKDEDVPAPPVETFENAPRRGKK